MIATYLPTNAVQAAVDNVIQSQDAAPSCYSLTMFTQRWKEIRDFYVGILNAKVFRECEGRYCDMEMGGMPICLRASEMGETVSYFHLHLALKDREPVLKELRKRGIIVTMVGAYTNFRDPEGRVIKLSEQKTHVS